MRYLIIDKKQRVSVPTMGEIPTGSARLIEELDKKNIEHSFIYNDNLEFLFRENKTQILANGEDITNYSHIIFRGHSLGNEREYHFKRYIIDYIDKYNTENPEKKIKVQNAQAIKNLPYYNKIAIAMLCSKHKIPHFNSYYRSDGNYMAERDFLNDYPLILKEYNGENKVVTLDGNRKIKKNVYKIDSPGEYSQNVNKEDLNNFFLQEFSEEAEDFRLFMKLGKVIGGWKRRASNGFITVNKGIYEMNNQPSQEMVDIAEKVYDALDADFMAVDIMKIDGKAHLQEISLHPGYKAYETKIPGEPVNIAEAIITAFRE